MNGSGLEILTVPILIVLWLMWKDLDKIRKKLNIPDEDEGSEEDPEVKEEAEKESPQGRARDSD